MRLTSLLIGLGLLAALSACTRGDQTAPPAPPAAGSDVGIDAVRSQIVKIIGDNPDTVIRRAASGGLYEVQTGMNFGYVSADGKVFVAGDLFDAQTGKNLTETARRVARASALAELGGEKTIAFAPEGGADPARVVTIFTDIDCGYCRMLHRDIAKYIEQGIEIRYLLYPRSGPDTDSYRKAQTVWCADDRQQALTRAKAGEDVVGNTGCENPVDEVWQTGHDIGLRGTPMMVLSDGEVIDGYIPADALNAHLKQKSAPPG